MKKVLLQVSSKVKVFKNNFFVKKLLKVTDMPNLWKIFRELYFRSSSLYCSAKAYYITEVLLKLVTQSNGHRTRQKKKRTEQRLGQNIMKPKLCLALALFSLVVICQAIPEEVDSGFISLFCYYTLGKIGTQHYLCFPFC